MNKRILPCKKHSIPPLLKSRRRDSFDLREIGDDREVLYWLECPLCEMEKHLPPSEVQRWNDEHGEPGELT